MSRLDPSASRRSAELTGFVVKPHHCGFRAGVDTGKLNQLVDELDGEDFKAETPGSRA